MTARMGSGWAWIALFATLACDDGATVSASRGRLLLGTRTVDFGAVHVGTTSGVRTVRITNVGTALVRLDGVVPGEPFDADAFAYQIDDFALPPNQSVFLSVEFSPVRVGAQSSRIDIRSTVAGESVEESVTLLGAGVSSRIVATPEALSFGNVLVGTTRELSVRIQNQSDFSADIELQTSGNLDPCAARTAAAFCLTSAGRDLLEDPTIRVGPADSVDIDVVFRPTIANVEEVARLTLRTCPRPECELDVEMRGFGVERGFVCEPRTLDFGAVNPGACRQLSLLCSNVANEQVTVTGWALSEASSTDFEVERFTTAVLQPGSGPNPGGTVEIGVDYCPQDLGDDEGRLRVTIDDEDPRREQTLVELVGSGGGPDIEITPKQLSFGLVSLAAPAKRSVLVTNVGFEDLVVAEISVVGEAGSAFRVSGDAGVVPVGGSVPLEIEFAPTVAGVVQERLVVQSNDADEPEVEVLVRGEGIDLPPCNFELSRASLNFGSVQTTRSNRAVLEVRNLSQTSECLVNSVTLEPGSDPEFSMPETYDSVFIPPGAALAVSARYAPERRGTHQGALEISISDPNRPLNRVELIGQATDAGLLIVPNDLFYGTVAVGCSARAKTVTIYNTGAVRATIDSVELDSQPGVFRLIGLPPVPLGIQPGASVQFTVGFTAPAASDYAGSVTLTGTFNDRPTTYVISMQGRGAVDAVQVDDFVQLGKPKVDLLFVVDNSCSMGPEQNSLAANFDSFIQFAEDQSLDYHIAVTTTDVQVEAGRFVPISGPASNRIVTPRTQPSPREVFVDNVVLGNGGGVPESGLQAAYLALSHPLITSHNAGFLRQDAVLSVIFVSDEADGSSGALNFYSNFLRSIKGFRSVNQFSASAILATEGGGCVGPRAPWEALRYQTIQEATGGVFGDICTNDWGTTLEELSTTAFGFKSRFFLTNQPVIQTIEIFVDGVRLPATEDSGRRNWTYDFSANAVDFKPLATPLPGSTIRVEYTAQCL